MSSRTTAGSLDPGSVVRLRYLPELDGLRGIAIVGVMGTHLMHWLFPGGGVGVDVFFVLSGYLITSLLVGEWSENGRIDLRSFWMRRVLRLMPAVTVFIGAAAVSSFIAGDSLVKAGGSALLSVLYVGNIVRAAGVPFSLTMAHLWSLAIEEQFYLVWPVAFTWAMRRRVRLSKFLTTLLVLILAVTLWRVVLSQHGVSDTRLRIAPDTRADILLIGCAIGLGVSWGSWSKVVTSRAVAVLLWPSVLGLVAWVFLGRRNSDPEVWAYSATALASAIVLLNVLNPARVRLRAALRARPLTWLGRISYALYLWHLLVLTLVERYLPTENSLIIAIVTIPPSLGLAVLSGVYVEAPFRRMKHRFEPRGRAVPPASTQPAT